LFFFVRLEKQNGKGYNNGINGNGEKQMALTAYCKKCNREVDAGGVCPFCGSKLGKNAAHAAWCVERTPVRDWMCWNALMRILLPAALFILLLVLLAEGIAGGIAAVEKMLVSGFPVVLLILLGTILLMAFAALLLQGKELADYVVDNRGVHEIHYLPNPTPLRLIARLRSPSLMKQVQQGNGVSVLKLSEKDLPWKNVARVQLWPEKCMILYYAPSWWLRIAAACTPFVWDDVMGITREKLGKKRKIRLPASLVIPAEQRARRTVTAPRPAFEDPEPDAVPEPPEESPGQMSLFDE
jgi:hypothetical protein